MTDRTIRSPVDWVGWQAVNLFHLLAWLGRALRHAVETMDQPAPAVRRIGIGDLGLALRQGWADFTAYRTDVFFLIFVYPLLCFGMARIAFGLNMLPMLFPLASGLALVGPFAAVGLYEMSRRREAGLSVNWRNGFDVVQRPSIGSIIILGMLVTALFLFWLGAAWAIYKSTMGFVRPLGFMAFFNDVLTTPGGHLMILYGVGLGFVFALLAMTVSVVSFPLMVDRDLGFDTAIRTSFLAVLTNLVPMAAWGMIVVVLLVLAAIPLGIGLIVVLPVLGHATWHLYRRLVAA